MAHRRPGTIEAALRRSIAAAKTEPIDAAVLELALRYAQAIDTDLEEITRAGPKLLDALIELRMTPKARTAVLRGATGDDRPGASKLDELRARRERRAAAVDAAP